MLTARCCRDIHRAEGSGEGGNEEGGGRREEEGGREDKGGVAPTSARGTHQLERMQGFRSGQRPLTCSAPGLAQVCQSHPQHLSPPTGPHTQHRSRRSNERRQGPKKSAVEVGMEQREKARRSTTHRQSTETSVGGSRTTGALVATALHHQAKGHGGGPATAPGRGGPAARPGPHQVSDAGGKDTTR
jgi:hypothetical protein